MLQRDGSEARTQKPLDLGAVLNRKIKSAFAKIGITGAGWIVGTLDPYWTLILGRGSRNLLKEMVGTMRLELLTSTVSR